MDDDRLDVVLCKPVFRTLERVILPDDHLAYLQEAGRTCAHVAWTECRGHDEFTPVAAASGIANAADLGMCRRITRLDPQVVSGGEYGPIGSPERCTDRDSTFVP